MTPALGDPDGWTCPTCGELTPFNAAHDCPGIYGGIYRGVGAGANPPSKQLTLTRIADALERIADQFEKGSDELDVMKGAEEEDVETRERRLERIRAQTAYSPPRVAPRPDYPPIPSWDRLTGMSE